MQLLCSQKRLSFFGLEHLLSLVRVSFSVLVTPRMVKLPSMSNVFGPV